MICFLRHSRRRARNCSAQPLPPLSAGEDDGIASASDIEAEANVANVERMRAESDKRKRKRRGSQTTPRARGKSLTSPWTTTAASVSQNIDGSWAATCRLCQASLKLGKTASSTNVKNHWASQHAGVYRRWELASENDKLKVLQDALAVARSQVSQLDVFARQARRSSVQSNAKLVRRVCGVFMIASSQSPWALLDSPGVETYLRHDSRSSQSSPQSMYFMSLRNIDGKAFTHCCSCQSGVRE